MFSCFQYSIGRKSLLQPAHSCFRNMIGNAPKELCNRHPNLSFFSIYRTYNRTYDTPVIGTRQVMAIVDMVVDRFSIAHLFFLLEVELISVRTELAAIQGY